MPCVHVVEQMLPCAVIASAGFPHAEVLQAGVAQAGITRTGHTGTWVGVAQAGVIRAGVIFQTELMVEIYSRSLVRAIGKV